MEAKFPFEVTSLLTTLDGDPEDMSGDLLILWDACRSLAWFLKLELHIGLPWCLVFFESRESTSALLSTIPLIWDMSGWSGCSVNVS